MEYVRLQLEDMQERLGVDIYRDGLEIRSTLDLDMQQAAEEACAAGVARLDSMSMASFLRRDWLAWARTEHPGWSEDRLRALRRDPAHQVLLDSLLLVQAALVALEPGSGAIRALVGGRDFERSRYNRVVQAVRQPGSAFKPFVYTAAIDNGYPPTFRISNGPLSVEDGTGKLWSPQNYDGKFGGMTTLRNGLKESYNLVAVRLLMDVVPPDLVVRYARQMGISTPIHTDLAMALGASGVRPLELVSAYSCLANGGIHHTPFSVLELRDRQGHVVWRHRPASREALSGATAALMTDMLGTVMDEGTGSSARWRHNFRAPAAGKTGTTNAYTDAWFVGYTPLLACGVWLGHDDPRFSLGSGMAGGQAALPVWAQFMRESYLRLQLPELPFERPASIVELDICADSYELAGPFCPHTIRDRFLKAYQPTGGCTLHRIN
jgi:penicillin-binding protein 1A